MKNETGRQDTRCLAANVSGKDNFCLVMLPNKRDSEINIFFTFFTTVILLTLNEIKHLQKAKYEIAVCKEL